MDSLSSSIKAEAHHIADSTTWEWWMYLVLGAAIIIVLSCLNGCRKSIVEAYECMKCVVTCGGCCCKKDEYVEVA